ncbi:MAG: thermonuclease family protein [Candidatus Latescibacterota bacterium]
MPGAVGSAAGAEAGQVLAALALGKRARVDSIDTDRYGRTVARVRIGRRWASEYLLRAGLVWVYPEYCLRRERRKWRRLEADAVAGPPRRAGPSSTRWDASLTA